MKHLSYRTDQTEGIANTSKASNEKKNYNLEHDVYNEIFTLSMTGRSSLLSIGIEVECTQVFVQRCLRRT